MDPTGVQQSPLHVILKGDCLIVGFLFQLINENLFSEGSIQQRPEKPLNKYSLY